LCPFKDAKQAPNTEWYDDDLGDFCAPGSCPFAAARPVVKVKDCNNLEYYAAKKDTEDKGKGI